MHGFSLRGKNVVNLRVNWYGGVVSKVEHKSDAISEYWRGDVTRQIDGASLNGSVDRDITCKRKINS